MIKLPCDLQGSFYSLRDQLRCNVKSVILHTIFAKLITFFHMYRLFTALKNAFVKYYIVQICTCQVISVKMY